MYLPITCSISLADQSVLEQIKAQKEIAWKRLFQQFMSVFVGHLAYGNAMLLMYKGFEVAMAELDRLPTSEVHVSNPESIQQLDLAV